MEREVVVAVTEVRLGLGPREQIFYGEFDAREESVRQLKLLVNNRLTKILTY
jgi:thiamine phosphate synthase YjbQ (UPF0047 family)